MTHAHKQLTQATETKQQQIEELKQLNDETSVKKQQELEKKVWWRQGYIVVQFVLQSTKFLIEYVPQ